MKQPTIDQRLAMRQRPHGSALMYQSWNDLLFLHWRVEPDAIQAKLPKGLFVDCFEDQAYLGLVPFYMRNIHFRWTPSLPWISYFLEINLRTYVVDEAGTPGVWFFSLDCNQPLAVWAARTLFQLPYQHAKMSAPKNKDGEIDYRSFRAHSKTQKGLTQTQLQYRIHPESSYAEPGTLDFFLAERYLLFAVNRKGKLRTGQVHHTPYPLSQVSVEQYETDLFELNGFASPMRRFDHAVGSRGVDVEIFPLSLK